MADLRYLQRRHQSWYFTIAVPREVRAHFNRTHIVLSLKTRDLTIAQRDRWQHVATWQERFNQRRGGNGLTLADIEAAAQAYYATVVATLEREQSSRETLLAFESTTSDALEAGDHRPVEGAIRGVLAERGLELGLDVDSSTYDELGDALLRAYLAALTGRLALLDGRPWMGPGSLTGRAVVPTQPDSTSAASGPGTGNKQRSLSKGTGHPFLETAARLLADRQRDPRAKLTEQTVGQYEAANRLLGAWMANKGMADDLGALDRRTASSFLDDIAKLDPHWGRGNDVKAMSWADLWERFGDHESGLSAKTVNRYAMALGLIWDFAESRDGYEGGNPWHRQSRAVGSKRGNARTGKRGYTKDEMHRLLALKPSSRIAASYAGVLPWLIWISAYSGMRLNQICSLEVANVKQVEGVWCFDLDVSNTEAGVRVVPVHDELLKLGLLELRKAVGSGQLFPVLKPGGPDKKLSWHVSKVYTFHRVRQLKIVDIDAVTGKDRIDYHSFKRTVVTVMKNARIPEHEVAEVVGHKHPNVTFGVYPDRAKVQLLQRIVRAIRY